MPYQLNFMFNSNYNRPKRYLLRWRHQIDQKNTIFCLLKKQYYISLRPVFNETFLLSSVG